MKRCLALSVAAGCLLASAASAQDSSSAAYRCASDSARTARSEANVDPALRERIAAAFPGWRLSTEQEIACRFPLQDGTTPATYIDDFGSGNVWWVRHADLDGDGEADTVAVLTAQDDPRRDHLAVLLGSGSNVLVTPLDGWGFALLERGAKARLAVIYWDKAADLYTWRRERFVMEAPGGHE